MDSKDKIRSYYERKEISSAYKKNYINKTSKSSSKRKFLTQGLITFIIIIIFGIFLKFENINTFNKIISNTKNFLEENIHLEKIENFIKNINIFNKKTNVSIDQDVLENLKEELANSSIKK